MAEYQEYPKYITLPTGDVKLVQNSDEELKELESCAKPVPAPVPPEKPAK